MKEEKSGLSALLERVADFYHAGLHKAAKALEFLRIKHLHSSELVEQFLVGYSDGSLNKVLPSDPEVRKKLQDAAIIDSAGKETFLDCLVLPILDPENTVAGLWGISLTDVATHLTADCPISLWNSPALRNNATVYLADDPIDGLSLYQAGYPNICALLDGRFSVVDAKAMSSYGTSRIVLLTGTVSAELLKSMPGTVQIFHRQIEQPLNALLIDKGPKRLAEYVEPLAETELENPNRPTTFTRASGDSLSVVFGRRRYEVRGLDKGSRRLKATVRVEHAGRIHVDTLDFYSAKARKNLCMDLARLFEESAGTIETDVSRIMATCEQHDPGKAKDASEQPVMTEEERKEAEEFGASSDLLKNILADFESYGLIGEEANKLLCYIASISRKMPCPLSVLILSSSGAGKTTLQDATIAFCPPEDVVKVTSLSGKALFYKGRHSLKHKILALEEGAGAEDASYAIRNLISAGELIIEATVKDLGTGKLTTMQNRVEGPTAVFITTTDPDVDPETRSRFFITSVDESRDQTRAILAFQRSKHTYAGFKDTRKREQLLKKHHNFQRLLKPYSVVNPHAEDLVYSDDRLESRRNQPKYLGLINAVAFLRQMRKTPKKLKTGAEYISVDQHDIHTATGLACEIMGRSLDDLNEVSRKLLGQIELLVHSKQKELRKSEGKAPEINRIRFTLRELREYTGWCRRRSDSGVNWPV